MPDPNDSFSKKFVEGLLLHHGAEKYTTKKGNTAYLVNNVVIRLPDNNKKMSYEMLEEIALEQLEISIWDLDYYIGEN